MQCTITLNQQALLNNYRSLIDRISRSNSSEALNPLTDAAPRNTLGPPVAPVLKSNAYGHGLVECYRILESLRPTWICVNYAQEGALLRKLGFTGRLLIVGPATKASLENCYEANLEPVVGNFAMLEYWRRMKRRPSIHLKFDTGMSRQGFDPVDVEQTITQASLARDQVAGVCTHFANVEDVTEHTYADEQLQTFAKIANLFQDWQVEIICHSASSASAMIMGSSRFDLVRTGIALYGLWPSQATRLSMLQIDGNQNFTLEPVLAWTTEVVNLKTVRAGRFIGYGCTYRASRDMRIAVLPVGYYEGYPRLAGDGPSYVLIDGQRCQVVGRICMNMMMIDVSHVTDVELGNTVILIGQSGKDEIKAGDLASWANTIHYEIVTRLHPDIPRVVV